MAFRKYPLGHAQRSGQLPEDLREEYSQQRGTFLNGGLEHHYAYLRNSEKDT